MRHKPDQLCSSRFTHNFTHSRGALKASGQLKPNFIKLSSGILRIAGHTKSGYGTYSNLIPPLDSCHHSVVNILTNLFFSNQLYC